MKQNQKGMSQLLLMKKTELMLKLQDIENKFKTIQEELNKLNEKK